VPLHATATLSEFELSLQRPSKRPGIALLVPTLRSSVICGIDDVSSECPILPQMRFLRRKASLRRHIFGAKNQYPTVRAQCLMNESRKALLGTQQLKWHYKIVPWISTTDPADLNGTRVSILPLRLFPR